MDQAAADPARQRSPNAPLLTRFFGHAHPNVMTSMAPRSEGQSARPRCRLRGTPPAPWRRSPLARAAATIEPSRVRGSDFEQNRYHAGDKERCLMAKPAGNGHFPAISGAETVF